ncbi:hypothetical protein [Echinicola rosea]|uniref:Cardiolipin synthase N-terminal domain-containing protein n=1 Tax=Echinicola rosea TaxID=1807691 RepID=A0ABQ1VC92_9BACT|nr:hypothetical protein [Echinicola rosea]GGF49490.1 hypothetical protein GCM10011339_42610 [Echinicola rosea]
MDYNLPHQADKNLPMSVGDWIITLLISGLPVVGFIMLIVWAVDKSTPTTKSNYAKAALILYAITVALTFLFIGVIGFSFLSYENFESIK